jgi:cysteine desulfurase / selenocysteine lyase
MGGIVSSSFEVAKVRSDIPQLAISVREKPLVYLDNAATTLKPSPVIERVSQYYRSENSNVHRGAHWLAETGTGFYEHARDTVAKFIGAQNSSEVVFTRGTTESLNLVAQCLALLGAMPGPNRSRGLKAGDEVLVSELEHHSNIVPWQLACDRVGAVLKPFPISDSGEIDLEALQGLVTAKTRVIAFSCCSNVLGTITGVPDIVTMAKKVDAIVVVDAAQMVTAKPIDVQAWGADFVAFSGHKLFAPFGIGVLWAAADWLDVLPPYQGGGSMIDSVSFEKTTWANAPQKFEAGTPNVGGAIGLGRAIEWFGKISSAAAIDHAKALSEYARVQLASISGIRIYGEALHRTSIVSFNLDGVHASDVGTILDQQGVAIRAGHHCCQPLMRKLGCAATARASFSVYNQISEVDALVAAVKKAKEILL